MIIHQIKNVFSIQKKLYILLILLFYTQVTAQYKSSIFVGCAADFSSMNDMKGLQRQFVDQVNSSLNLNAKITESFSVKPAYKMGVKIPVIYTGNGQYFINLFIGYSSTGGRVHYQDYSGELGIDQILNGYSLGASFGYSSLNVNTVSLEYNISTRLIKTDLEIRNFLKLHNSEDSSVLEFSSYSIGIEPALVPSFYISNFKFGISFSYLLNLPSSLEFENFSDSFLVDSKGNKISAEWSGIKLGVIISYNF